MLGADHEIRIERASGGRVGRLAGQLVQEAGGELEARIRIHGLLALAEPPKRRERRRGHLRDGARLLGRRRVRDSFGRAPRRNGRPQRVHWLVRFEGSARSAVSTASGSGAVGRCADSGHSPVHSSSATCA